MSIFSPGHTYYAPIILPIFPRFVKFIISIISMWQYFLLALECFCQYAKPFATVAPMDTPAVRRQGGHQPWEPCWGVPAPLPRVVIDQAVHSQSEESVSWKSLWIIFAQILIPLIIFFFSHETHSCQKMSGACIFGFVYTCAPRFSSSLFWGFIIFSIHIFDLLDNNA